MGLILKPFGPDRLAGRHAEMARRPGQYGAQTRGPVTRPGDQAGGLGLQRPRKAAMAPPAGNISLLNPTIAPLTPEQLEQLSMNLEGGEPDEIQAKRFRIMENMGRGDLRSLIRDAAALTQYSQTMPAISTPQPVTTQLPLPAPPPHVLERPARVEPYRQDMQTPLTTGVLQQTPRAAGLEKQGYGDQYRADVQDSTLARKIDEERVRTLALSQPELKAENAAFVAEQAAKATARRKRGRITSPEMIGLPAATGAGRIRTRPEKIVQSVFGLHRRPAEATAPKERRQAAGKSARQRERLGRNLDYQAEQAAALEARRQKQIEGRTYTLNGKRYGYTQGYGNGYLLPSNAGSSDDPSSRFISTGPKTREATPEEVAKQKAAAYESPQKEAARHQRERTAKAAMEKEQIADMTRRGATPAEITKQRELNALTLGFRKGARGGTRDVTSFGRVKIAAEQAALAAKAKAAKAKAAKAPSKVAARPTVSEHKAFVAANVRSLKDRQSKYVREDAEFKAIAEQIAFQEKRPKIRDNNRRQPRKPTEAEIRQYKKWHNDNWENALRALWEDEWDISDLERRRGIRKAGGK